MNETERCWLRLHLTPGLGRVGLERLVAAFGTPQEILAAPAREWVARAGVRASVAAACPAEEADVCRTAAASLEQCGARLLSRWDGDYPALLATIHDPPALLYLRGALPGGDAFAVVGSRRASAAGRRLTGEICADLAGRGITIVSGLARGVDAAAHEGALAGGGVTLAVLGCGIDQVYPPEHGRLADQIVGRGALLSEYPPGAQPLAGHFPGRNRIISGLSRGVLVVEAGEESGSLLTVDFALEQGREVFAVPGAVYSDTGRGVNRLLKEGARPVTEARDILEALWPQLPSRARQQHEDRFAATLDGKALSLFRQLGDEPLCIDELAGQSGLTPMEVSAILLTLELQGGVQQLAGMRFVRSRRP